MNRTDIKTALYNIVAISECVTTIRSCHNEMTRELGNNGDDLDDNDTAHAWLNCLGWQWRGRATRDSFQRPEPVTFDFEREPDTIAEAIRHLDAIAVAAANVQEMVAHATKLLTEIRDLDTNDEPDQDR